RPDRRSATEEDRRAIASWLEGHGHVYDIHIGPLVDAWHPAPVRAVRAGGSLTRPGAGR
ncbi:MAG: DUF469 family protein, partial [Candidatus Rokubacteria bacterium]|nr:DUF469 family protein [Candidatus Rokubacteria bacterium]